MDCDDADQTAVETRDQPPFPSLPSHEDGRSNGQNTGDVVKSNHGNTFLSAAAECCPRRIRDRLENTLRFRCPDRNTAIDLPQRASLPPATRQALHQSVLDSSEAHSKRKRGVSSGTKTRPDAEKVATTSKAFAYLSGVGPERTIDAFVASIVSVQEIRERQSKVCSLRRSVLTKLITVFPFT